MFVYWLDITASSVLDLLWYLVVSSPPLTSPDSPAEEKPLSPQYPQSPPQCIHIEHSTPPLYALVIGIDKYLSDNISNLHGAVADADAVDIFLHETLGVPEHRIKNIRNENATRATIETEIKRLGDNSAIKKDDPILIYYAGHGAEANAPSEWPTDNGKIQMLVPHDFEPRGSSDSKRGQGVLDMRLSHLLADLAMKKSDNITVILDCCHSGSGTRTVNHDPTFAVRGIELPETYTIPRGLFHHDVSHYKSRSSSTAQGFERTGLSSHMLLSACKQGQEAREADGHGAFTSALLSLLKKSGVDKLTYKDVITHLPDLPAQNPQCEGVNQFRRLFNSKVASPQRKLYDIRVSRCGRYVLEAGSVHGITKNAEFAVFADRNMVSELGTIVASRITAFTTTCDFHPRGNETPFFLAHPGFALQTRVGEGHDVRLFIEPVRKLFGVLKRIGEEMQNGEARQRRLHLVESRNDHPDLAVSAHGDVVHFEIMDKLCRQHGLTRMPFKVKIDDSDTIHRILRCSAHFYWHLHQSSQGSPLAGKVTLECMKLQETRDFIGGSDKVLMPDPHGHNLNIGGVIVVNVDEKAMYGFKITNTTSVCLYVSMFYFDVSDLKIVPYYQPGSAKDGAVDVSLPPGESSTIGYGASGTVPHTYTLKKGQDVDVGFLKLFFSTEYKDLSGITQSSPFGDSRKSDPVPEKKRYVGDTMCIAVVQKHGEGPSRCRDRGWDHHHHHHHHHFT